MNHYTSFFHLREDPFVLTPDPKYLFLGKRHREVMSHLLYGIQEEKGFMIVVGEVGTGKTTLCRAFINQLLKQKVEVGLIYNPAMTDLELLQAINREFGIPSEFDSRGKLIDALNAFLLKVNGEGRKVVLIIDEAQNLDPSVMEQIRLISNLETETGKLIQIILLGQPELERILSKREMRQLDQRIVVRGLLGPFHSRETADYIRHRLKIASIAGGENGVEFSDGACRRIHRLSEGTPRLINVLADRALLVAYARGKRKIDGAIVKSAHRDLESSRYRPKSGPFALRWQTGVIFAVLLTLLSGWLYEDFLRSTAARTGRAGALEAGTAAAPVKGAEPARGVIKAEKEVPREETVDRIFSPLQGMTREENWCLALESVFGLWKETVPARQGLAAGQLPPDSRLRIWEIFGSLTVLRALNYPAVVELKRPGQDVGIYSVLKRFEGDRAVLIGAGEEVVPIGVFTGLWYGHAYVFWKDFEGHPQIIYPKTSSLAVTWLQRNLKFLNLFDGPVSGYYDENTREAVVRLQKKWNLFVDGIVGPQTMMVLYSQLAVYPRPTLTDQGPKGILDR